MKEYHPSSSWTFYSIMSQSPIEIFILKSLSTLHLSFPKFIIFWWNKIGVLKLLGSCFQRSNFELWCQKIFKKDLSSHCFKYFILSFHVQIRLRTGGWLFTKLNIRWQFWGISWEHQKQNRRPGVPRKDN